MEEKLKICRFYMEKKCKKGDQCNYVHDEFACRFYFFHGKCNKDNCSFEHKVTIHRVDEEPKKKETGKKRRPKNTENFSPYYDEPAMRIKIGNADCNEYPGTYHVNDVILVPGLFRDSDIYENLLKELKDSGLENGLWKSWHGESHLIADDDLNWKEKVPTFMKILERIKEYFRVDMKSTRLNWYQDTNDWKPFHHDAAAIKPHIAKIQNVTIAVSFGCTRNAAFEQNGTKTVISIPQENGSAYVFCRDVNVHWKHGILREKNYKEEGRISVIVWGYVEQEGIDKK